MHMDYIVVAAILYLIVSQTMTFKLVFHIYLLPGAFLVHSGFYNKKKRTTCKFSIIPVLTEEATIQQQTLAVMQ